MIMAMLMIHTDNYVTDTFSKVNACENTGQL